MVNRLSKIIFHDDILLKECEEWIPDSTAAIVPNSPGNDIVGSADEVLSRILRGPGSPIRILFLSNMIREKGYLTLLHAAAILKQKNLRFGLEFVGGWYSENDKSDFFSEVERLNLNAEVTHHGAVSDRSMIRQFHLSADVFVLPTFYPTEASPMSIIEALSAGTPVITTRQGGIPEIVTDGSEAILIEPKDPSAIAEAVSRLQNHTTWTTMAYAARARFESHYHPDIVHSKWIKLLNEVNLQDS